MQVAICENNAAERDHLIRLLTEYFETELIPYKFAQYKWGMHLVEDIEDGAYFDIVVLNIYLHDHPGMEVARRIRKLQFNGSIIFVASSADYAVESYEVEAMDYILKPLDKNRLFRTLNRITQYYSDQMYLLQQRTNLIRVPYKEIVFVESSNSKCFLHRKDGTVYTLYKRLDEVVSELSDERYLRCHQSYLINMDYVSTLGTDFILSTGDRIVVPKRILKAVREKFLEYCN